MYTEDDTFRHLTRCTFEEMRNIVIGLALAGKSPTERGRALKDYGWTAHEYNQKRIESIPFVSPRNE